MQDMNNCIDFSGSSDDFFINKTRNVSNGLKVSVQLFRTNTQTHQIAILNSKGKLSTFKLIKMVQNDAYSSISNRPVWLAVNSNNAVTERASDGMKLHRNSNCGVVDLFLTPMLREKYANPYNCLLVNSANIRTALVPTDNPDPQVAAMFAYLVEKATAIEAADTDEDGKTKALKDLFGKYQANLKKFVAAGALAPSQVLFADDNSVSPVIGMNNTKRSSNPWFDFESLAKTFKFSNLPTQNSVSGFVSTTLEEPDVDLEVGTRNLSNTRKETSRVATVTDGYGNSSNVIVRVQDLAYEVGEKVRKRSAVFEELTQEAGYFYVHGSLNTFGSSLAITIENYAVQKPPASHDTHSIDISGLFETDIDQNEPMNAEVFNEAFNSEEMI